jgi:O-antigen/teichoic acid export membrane protein
VDENEATEAGGAATAEAPSAASEHAGARQSVAAGSAMLFVAQIVANTGFFVAVLLLARGLTTGGRGTIAFVTVTAAVTSRFVVLGVGQSVTVFATQQPERRRTILSNIVCFTLAVTLAAGAAVALVLHELGSITPNGVSGSILFALALGTVATGFIDAGYGFLLGSERIRQQSLITAASPWLYAAMLGLVAAVAGLNVVRAAWVWTGAQGVWALLLIGASHRRIGFGRPSLRLLRQMIRLGVRLWPGTLSRFLNFRVDQVLMGFIASEAALGVYAIAVNASEVMLYLPGAVATALIPAVARAPSDEQVPQTLRTFRALIVITLPAIVVAVAIGPFLIPVVFGHAYHASIVPFLWLIPGAIGYAASGVFSSALIGTRRPVLFSLGPIASLASGFVLDVILIPPLGATGAAIAATAAFAAGGTAAIAAYAAVTRFDLPLLVPRPADVAATRDLIRSLRARLRTRTEARPP